jgi:hypothetical protein
MAQIQEKLNAVKQQRASYKPFTPSGKYWISYFLNKTKINLIPTTPNNK